MRTKSQAYYKTPRFISIDQQYLQKKEKTSPFHSTFIIACLSVALLIFGGVFFFLFSTMVSPPFSATVRTRANFTSFPLSSISHETWRHNTLALLEKTRLWNGSYDGNFALATGPYDPYTTYFATLTYRALGDNVPEASETIQALRGSQEKSGRFPCEIPTPGENASATNQVDCLFYVTFSLKNLDSSPQGIGSIADRLNRLEAPNGLYAANPELLATMNKNPSNTANSLSLLATDRAVAILRLFSISPKRKAQLQNWLLSHWEVGAPATMNTFDKVSYLASIAEALESLGEQAPQVASQTTWIEQACQRATDLTSLPTNRNQPTNLVVITDCMSLEQSLSDRSQGTSLLSPSFLSELSMFQQPNGNFNTFFLSQPAQPDIQGIYLFTHLLKQGGQVIPRAANMWILLSHQLLTQGGFFPVFTTLSPNAMNISLSIQTRDLLGAPIDSADQIILHGVIKSLLQDTISNQHVDMENLYYAFALGKELGLDVTSLASPLKKLSVAFIQSLGDHEPLTNNQLQDAYYLTQMVDFNEPATQKLLNDIFLMQDSSGGFASNGSSTLESTWQAVSIIEHSSSMGLSEDQSQQTISWVLQHQSTSGGFTEVGQTNVYSSYFAVEILSLLNEKAFSGASLANWLRSLEYSQGGILPQAKLESGPTLLATYEALIIAQKLDIAP